LPEASAVASQLAIADLELTMQLNKTFVLTAVPGAETFAAQHRNHRVLALQF